MSSVVVVDDVSPVVWTGDIERIRNCGSSVDCFFKAQNPIIFVGFV